MNVERGARVGANEASVIIISPRSVGINHNNFYIYSSTGQESAALQPAQEEK